MVVRLELHPEHAAFEKAAFVEREDSQVQAIILRNPFDGESALQRELLDMVCAQVGQHMLACAPFARRAQWVLRQAWFLARTPKPILADAHSSKKRCELSR